MCSILFPLSSLRLFQFLFLFHSVLQTEFKKKIMNKNPKADSTVCLVSLVYFPFSQLLNYKFKLKIGSTRLLGSVYLSFLFLRISSLSVETFFFFFSSFASSVCSRLCSAGRAVAVDELYMSLSRFFLCYFPLASSTTLRIDVCKCGGCGFSC